MEEERKTPRWSYMVQFLIVFAGQMWMLSDYEWNVIVMYTTAIFPWYCIILVWFHLWWGVHNLVKFINYNADVNEIDSIGKNEE
jgi:hypothetical protein